MRKMLLFLIKLQLRAMCYWC